MSVPRKTSGEWGMARKSLDRTFSPPPRWSVTGMPLLWKAGSSNRPPPPTWRTKGTSASLRVAQNQSRSGWVGARSPAAVEGTMMAPHPCSMASVANSTARAGCWRGTEPTATSRSSAEQKLAMARFWARLPAYNRSRSRPVYMTEANVAKTSWRRNPRRSRAWLRSSGEKAPTAIQPLSSIKCSSAAVAAVWSVRRRSARAVAFANAGLSASTSRSRRRPRKAGSRKSSRKPGSSMT